MIAAALVAVALTTGAAPPEATLAVVGHAQLVIAPAPGAWTVCGIGSTGSSNLAGAWVLQVSGVAGTPIPLQQRVVPNPTISTCITVSRLGLSEGFIDASLSFAGGVTYAVAGSVGGAAWGPVIGDQPFTVDLQR